MNKIKKKKYQLWRRVQREQLGYSSNIYFVFSSAILVSLLNLLIGKKDIIDCKVLIILAISTAFILISILFYGLFTHNRLKDFRETAKYFKEGKNSKEVRELTINIGERTWAYYYLQIVMLTVGFVLSIFGVSIFIYS